MTNEAGAATWTGSYYPFGEAATPESGTNTHQFTGKEWDSEMGLNYFCQRYYDPQVARFMTLDPVDDKKGFSPYAYCLNNPLKFTDPTGEVSMAQKWIEWQMADDAAFWGTMQDIVFSNYDEYGNLIGQDYYSPSTVNNPYLESFLIPPPEYFAVLFNPPSSNVPAGEVGREFSHEDMTMLMHALYVAGMYGGGCGREAILGYIGATVFWSSMPDAFGAFTNSENRFVQFNPAFTSPRDFLRTAVHEGFHLGEHWTRYIDLIVTYEESMDPSMLPEICFTYLVGPSSPSWLADWILFVIGPDWRQ